MRERFFRKSKDDAWRDFWHTLRLGLALFLLLLLVLPPLMR